MSFFFNASKTLILSGTGENSNVLDIYIGDMNTPVAYNVVGQVQSAQPLRTQFDVALDNTLYALSAGKGIAPYQVTFMDGPFEYCDGRRSSKMTSLLERYSQIAQTRNRLVKVYVYDRGSGGTRPAATFKGVVTQLSHQIGDNSNEGTSVIYSTLFAQGLWI